MTPAIIIHGGAHAISPEQEDASRRGCAAAAEAGWAVLERGGSALDAVEAAVRVLEDDPTFNAGLGSELNAAGEVETDAACMEGTTFQCGGVAGVQGLRHPISAARCVLESEYVLLVDAGARQFAQDHGAELCDPAELVTEQRRQDWEAQKASGTGTVGAAAVDRAGRLAAATSTGGTGTNPPGRVGDTPLPGCGYWADDARGACSTTGIGETIARVVLAKSAVDRLGGESGPDEAAAAAVRELEERVQGEAGLILVDPEGRVGWAHNAENMACAYRAAGMAAAAAYLHKREEADGAQDAE